MTRITAMLLTVLETAVAALISYGVAFVPLTLLWAMHFGMMLDIGVFARAAGDVWLLGHGVNLQVKIADSLATQLGIAGAEQPFSISVALIGFGLITVFAGRRIGRRAVWADVRIPCAVIAVGMFVGVGLLVGLLSKSPGASPGLFESAVFPALVMAVGVLLGVMADGGVDNLLARTPLGKAELSPRLVSLGNAIETAREVCRIGAGAAFGLIGVAAVLTVIQIVTRYDTIINLHQALAAGIDGDIAITVAELSLIPNAIIWATAWLVGPGFVITGGLVGPIGTTIGPVPGLPLFGALPSHPSPVAGLGLVLPAIFGLAGVILALRKTPLNPSRWHPLLVGVGSGLVSGVLLGGLAWLSGGSIGPGRLSQMGPSGLLVGLVVAGVVGLGAVIGGYLRMWLIGRQHSRVIANSLAETS